MRDKSLLAFQRGGGDLWLGLDDQVSSRRVNPLALHLGRAATGK